MKLWKEASVSRVTWKTVVEVPTTTPRALLPGPHAPCRDCAISMPLLQWTLTKPSMLRLPCDRPKRRTVGLCVGRIDRGIRRHSRCRDTRGLLPGSFTIYRWVV